VAEKADAQTLRAEQKLQRFLALDIPDVADKADVKVLGRRRAIAPDVRVGRQWQPADARETERLAVTDVLDLRLENPSALVFQQARVVEIVGNPRRPILVVPEVDEPVADPFERARRDRRVVERQSVGAVDAQEVVERPGAQRGEELRWREHAGGVAQGDQRPLDVLAGVPGMKPRDRNADVHAIAGETPAASNRRSIWSNRPSAA
jgi:hypothetical protein